MIGIGLLALGGLPVVIFALVGLPHVIRGPAIRNVVTGATATEPYAPGETRFQPTFELLTGAALLSGSGADILANGDETFPKLWSDLRRARRSITVQMYYVAASSVADTLAAILAARARSGVDVYFLYDSFGAQQMAPAFIEGLRSAGVRVAEFRPVRWYALDRANHRSHIRGVVIDGWVAYTGGFGLDDKWRGNGHAVDQWRDTNVRFTGRAAAALQAAFVAKWSEAAGELLADDRLLSDSASGVDSPGVDAAALLVSPSIIGSTTAERWLALSIASARYRLYITNAYFVPQGDFVALLVGAARRGVDVRILTNGPESDVESTRFAGHRQYGVLLKAGVRIWEYRPTTVHAKTLAADGLLASIGTANFDNRSLAYNSEVMFVARDARLGRALDSLFLDDLRFADEVQLPDFDSRSLGMRFREYLAGLIERIL